MFIERFTRYLQFEKRFSPHTITAYRHDLFQFKDFLGFEETDLNLVTHHDVRFWMLNLMENGADPRTVSRKLSVLRSLYKFLQREDQIQVNPMTLIKAPKIPKRLPVVIDEKKMDLLLDSDTLFEDGFPGLRDRLILELFYGTGIRLAEMISLKESDVNFYDQNIKVLGKRNKQRIIPLSQPLLQLVRKYTESKIAQNFDNKVASLIVTDKGMNAYPGFIYRAVKSKLSEISTHEKRSPHILRHSFATALLNKGADLNAIKELLGHASLAATQVYTHNSVEKLKLIYKQAHPKA